MFGRGWKPKPPNNGPLYKFIYGFKRFRKLASRPEINEFWKLASGSEIFLEVSLLVTESIYNYMSKNS